MTIHYFSNVPAPGLLSSLQMMHTQRTWKKPKPSDSCLCVVVLVTNILIPTWVTTGCEEKLLNSVLCVSYITHINDNNLEAVQIRRQCPRGTVVIQNVCFSFKWKNNSETETDNLKWLDDSQVYTSETYHSCCKSMHNMNHQSGHMKQFLSILSKPVFACANNVKVIYRRIAGVYDQVVVKKDNNGFVVCSSKKEYIKTHLNLFLCTAGGFISVWFVCDGNFDCPFDRSDEDHCVCPTKFVILTPCKFMMISGKKECSKLYFKTSDNKCQKYAEYNEWTIKNELEIQFITYQPSIPERIFYKGENYKKVNTTYFHAKCLDESLTPCQEDPFHCFSVSQVCVHRLDSNRDIFPCLDGSHLTLCKFFECNLMYKCSSAYCIPWTYVLDGKWDCPQGLDEQRDGLKDICNKMYKCKSNTRTCIPVGLVCNHVDDCTNGDDEFFCTLTVRKCPTNCACVLYSIHCISAKNDLFGTSLDQFMSIRISQTNVTSHLRFKHSGVKYLELSGCNIGKQRVMYPSKLVVLDLHNNLISEIDDKAFASLHNVLILDLSRNQISDVFVESFSGLTHMKSLNLSDNPLDKITGDPFQPLKCLQVLGLYKVNLDNIQIQAFENTNLSVVTTDYPAICCFTPESVTCHATFHWPFSCSNLLPDTGATVGFGVAICLVITFNMICGFLQSFSENVSKVLKTQTLFLTIAHLSASLYLGIIWVNNNLTVGNFALKQHEWIASHTCNTAQFVFILAVQLTSYFIETLSLSRYLVVAYPIKSKFRRHSFLRKVLLVETVVIIFSSALLVLVSKHLLEESLNIFCVHSYSTAALSNYLIWTLSHILILNSLVVCLLHILLIRKLHKRPQLDAGQHKKKSLYPMVMQLLALCVTNVCSSVSLIVLFFSSTFCNSNVQHCRLLQAWLLVSALSLNPILHPLVFVGVAFKSQKKQKSNSPLEMAGTSNLVLNT